MAGFASAKSPGVLLALAAGSWLGAACGGRTTSILDVGTIAATDDDDSSAGAKVDAGISVEAGKPDAGCRSNADCDDGIACTTDVCETGKCAAKPDDSACGLSEACEPAVGCEARAWAISGHEIHDVRLPSGRTSVHSTISTRLNDIALAPDGLLYAGSADAYALNPATNRWDSVPSTIVKPTGSILDATNALDFAPDGRLFGAGGGRLMLLGVLQYSTTKIGSFPTGLQSSGDIAFIGSRLFSSAGNVDNNASRISILIEFFIDGDAPITSRIIGPIGYPCVHGLAPSGNELYGFTCSGNILHIDKSTGKGTLIRNVAGATYSGATAR